MWFHTNCDSTFHLLLTSSVTKWCNKIAQSYRMTTLPSLWITHTFVYLGFGFWGWPASSESFPSCSTFQSSTSSETWTSMPSPRPIRTRARMKRKRKPNFKSWFIQSIFILGNGSHRFITSSSLGFGPKMSNVKQPSHWLGKDKHTRHFY